VKARKIVKQPGPYQSVLNSYLVEIAQLRETRPQPTPYRAIAKILKRSTGWRSVPTASGPLCALARWPRSEIKVQDRPRLSSADGACFPPPDPVCRLLAGRNKKRISNFQPLRPHGRARRCGPKNRKPRNGTWAMTRTNPLKTKPRMDQTTDRKQADRKQIIFTEGAKGGGGKPPS